MVLIVTGEYLTGYLLKIFYALSNKNIVVFVIYTFHQYIMF